MSPEEIDQLAQVFGFTHDALDANRNGTLTSAQLEPLWWVVGIIVALIALGGAGLLAAWRRWTQFPQRILMIVGYLVGASLLVGVAGLSSAADLLNRQVRSTQAQLSTVTPVGKNGKAVLKFGELRLLSNSHVAPAREVLRAQRRYTVYYLPNTLRLLSLEPAP